MFSKNGYWVKRDFDDNILGIVKVENNIDYYNFIEGKWVKKNKGVYDLLINPDWERATEEEVFKALGIK